MEVQEGNYNNRALYENYISKRKMENNIYGNTWNNDINILLASEKTRQC